MKRIMKQRQITSLISLSIESKKRKRENRKSKERKIKRMTTERKCQYLLLQQWDKKMKKLDLIKRHLTTSLMKPTLMR